MALATSSFPVPLSPVIITEESAGATFSTSFNTFFSETCDEYAEDEEEGAESADVEGEEDVEEY